MEVARAILTIIMGIFYYSTVAPVLTVLLLTLVVFNLIFEGNLNLLPIVVVWAWPIMLLMDPTGTMNSLGKVLEKEQEESGTS